MKLKHIFSAVVVAGASVAAHAAPALTEGFSNVAGLTGQGWAQVSTGTGAGAGWFQGNTGIFGAAAGAADSYAAANFVDSGAGTVSDWLMTPVLSLRDGMHVNFLSRLLGDGFLDTLEVWVSGAGSSTAVGSFSKIATFTATSDTGWTSQSVDLTGLSGTVDGRVAFRFFMANSNDGNYIGVDSLSVVPEPASLALVGLALAGVAAARRRRA